MTPNNIVNMAVIKGLDAISVTDHNSASNLPSIQEVSAEKGIVFLPGIEVQTKEEVHMLCYFRSIEDAIHIGNYVYERLPDIKNNERIFGNQYIFDSNDNITGSLDKLLLSSADISIEQLVDIVVETGGACIPAHIDRSSYSIISNLGFIPPGLNLNTVEISKELAAPSALVSYPFLDSYKIIRSSDAHYLWDISERENFISAELPALPDILNFLK